MPEARTWEDTRDIPEGVVVIDNQGDRWKWEGGRRYLYMDGIDGYGPFTEVVPASLTTSPTGPVYYISGPMTGIPEHNFPAFNAAAAYYRDRGFDVINPAEMDDQTEPDWDKKPWSHYLRRDLAELVKATHVVLLPGWDRSKGARLEIHVAKELGMSFVPHFPEEIR